MGVLRVSESTHSDLLVTTERPSSVWRRVFGDKLIITTMAKQIRMGVIGILAMAGLVLLAGEPIEEETWFEVFIATKIAGFALWGGVALLYKYWDKRGLLPEEDYEDEFI